MFVSICVFLPELNIYQAIRPIPLTSVIFGFVQINSMNTYCGVKLICEPIHPPVIYITVENKPKKQKT